MDGLQFQLHGFALIPLVGFLVFKRWQREKQRAAQKAAGLNGSYIGRPMDVEPLKARIKAVKTDYSTRLHDRTTGATGKRGLLSRARAKLLHLGFFQHQPSRTESELRTH